MGVQRLLAIIGSTLSEYVGLQTGTGVSSAGQIPALNAIGVLDATMLPVIDMGQDVPPSANGVLGIGGGTLANSDFGQFGGTADPVALISDWGMFNATAPTTVVDLGTFP